MHLLLSNYRYFIQISGTVYGQDGDRMTALMTVPEGTVLKEAAFEDGLACILLQDGTAHVLKSGEAPVVVPGVIKVISTVDQIILLTDAGPLSYSQTDNLVPISQDALIAALARTCRETNDDLAHLAPLVREHLVPWPVDWFSMKARKDDPYSDDEDDLDLRQDYGDVEVTFHKCNRQFTMYDELDRNGFMSGKERVTFHKAVVWEDGAFVPKPAFVVGNELVIDTIKVSVKKLDRAEFRVTVYKGRVIAHVLGETTIKMVDKVCVAPSNSEIVDGKIYYVMDDRIRQAALPNLGKKPKVLKARPKRPLDK